MQQQQKFYFGGASYLQVLQGLYRSLSGHGVALLLGESGVGKSALCDKLRQYLLRQKNPVLFLSNPPPSPEALRSILARELDLPDSANLAVLLPDALLSRSDETELKQLTLIVDDAHLLSDVTLLELAHFSVARVNGQAALRILLAGEPTLAERLTRQADLSELWRAINEGAPAQYQLEPMRAEQLHDFLLEYVRQSGRAVRQLSKETVLRLQKSCNGYPGPALRLAAQLQPKDFMQDPAPHSYAATAISARQSEEGSVGLAVDSERSWLARIEHLRGRALLPVAAVLVLASLAFLYQQVTGRGDAAPIDEVSQQAAVVATQGSDSLVVTGVGDDAGVEIGVATSPFVDEAAAEPPVDNAVEIGSALAEPEEASVVAPVPPLSEEQLNREALLAAIERARVAAQEQLASDQQASDSGLVLVTAEERGISEESFALPDIETLLTAAEEESDPQLQLDEPVEEVVAGIRSEPQQASIEASEEDMAVRWQDKMAGWVAAWQEQDLDAYFGYYHERFVPRYQNSISAWRRNRQRVIGAATDIELEMYDFDVISESADEVEVHFWLDYRSPSYQDQTRKKIVLAPYEGDWLIVEEINLEVRV